MVKNNGGEYYSEFRSSKIDVVIAKRDATETQKLKAAMNSQNDCLSVQWIRDSVEKGVALPIERYRIDLQAKQPTKQKSGNQSNITGCSVSLSISPIQLNLIKFDINFEFLSTDFHLWLYE